MEEYQKIQSVFKRDLKTKSLILGDWTLPEFEYLSGLEWIYTEKVNGTNIRVLFDGGKVKFGGRTDDAQISTKLLARLQEKFNESSFLSAFDQSTNICLYGEGYGAGIQKGGQNYRHDQDFVLFDVKIGDWWLKRPDVEDIAQKMGIEVVPIMGSGSLLKCINIVSNGISSAWGDFQAEGIVARPKIDLFGRNGDRIITKIKCRDFK